MGQTQEQAKMAHTPEPWSFKARDAGRTYTTKREHWVVGSEVTMDGVAFVFGEDAANVSRIVSCVNAMAGIPNPSEYREWAESAIKENVRLERSEDQLLTERDSAEDAMSHAYFLVIGKSPEWSNLFGYQEALEAIDDAQTTLRETIKTLTSERDAALRERDELREALESVVLLDKTAYDHHEPRPDGKLPRVEGGTCWHTPKEIARAALSQSQQGGEKKPDPLDEAVTLLGAIDEAYANNRKCVPDPADHVEIRRNNAINSVHDWLTKHKKS